MVVRYARNTLLKVTKAIHETLKINELWERSHQPRQLLMPKPAALHTEFLKILFRGKGRDMSKCKAPGYKKAKIYFNVPKLAIQV